MESSAKDMLGMECVDCSIQLPLRLSTGPDSKRIRCRYCGSMYRGTIIEDASEDLLANVEMMLTEPPECVSED